MSKQMHIAKIVDIQPVQSLIQAGSLNYGSANKVPAGATGIPVSTGEDSGRKRVVFELSDGTIWSAVIPERLIGNYRIGAEGKLVHTKTKLIGWVLQ